MTAVQCIEFNHQGSPATGTILKNKGICWQVELMDGSTCLVQKKHVTRQWEEAEALPTTLSDPLSMAAMALAAGNHSEVLAKEEQEPTPKKSKIRVEPAADRTDVVTLKQLCFELDIVPRIARRNLRKMSDGGVGIGSRYEWAVGSAELGAVRTALGA